MTQPSALITSAEVGEILGVDRATVTRYAIKGTLQSQKLPGSTGSYLFNRTDVERFIADRTAFTVAELTSLISEAERFAVDEPDRNSAAYHYLAGSLGIDLDAVRDDIGGTA